MRITLVCILLALYVEALSQTPELEIRKVMANQEQCWNEGNLVCFMKGYWESEELVFIGSKGLTYGWQQTLENYTKSYPNKEAMGELKFTLKIIEPLGEHFWFVVGQWELEKEKPAQGHFSLIWRNIDGEWKIVADHSS